MPDEADLANDHLERELEQRILDVQRAKPLPPAIECLNCGETVKTGRRYCDDACREDAELRDRQQRRSGIK